MSWVWIALLALLGLGVALGAGAYGWKARQARRADVLDAQRTAFDQLRQGSGIRPEDR